MTRLVFVTVAIMLIASQSVSAFRLRDDENSDFLPYFKYQSKRLQQQQQHQPFAAMGDNSDELMTLKQALRSIDTPVAESDIYVYGEDDVEDLDDDDEGINVDDLDVDQISDLIGGASLVDKTLATQHQQQQQQQQHVDQQRDEESESHSSLVAGHQYMSGGAGEGKQHLQPDGSVPNVEEVKSDEDLPAYCDPPNPCPVGYQGEECDSRPYGEYTAEFSKLYQDQQNCMCDDDHNECTKTSSSPSSKSKTNDRDMYLPVVAKKSPRVRRDVNDSKRVNKIRNPNLFGKAIHVHVAKKSAPIQ